MTIVAQNQPGSTLADVLRQSVQALRLMADATPVDIGSQFLKEGVGSSPRIVYVPEEGGGGKLGDAFTQGNAAGMTHSCLVAVRGKGSADALERFTDAYRLVDLVVSLIGTAATGKVEWGGAEDGSPMTVDSPAGVEIRFSFTYERDIPHNARRWALPPADADDRNSPRPPPGTFADGYTVDPTTEPKS